MPAALSAYQLGLRDVDDAVGAFIDELKDRDLYDNTTFIFFGDHGEEFFSHGLLTHSTLYEENLNVPFAIKLSADSDTQMQSQPINPHQFEAHTTVHRIVHELFGLSTPRHARDGSNSSLGLVELVSLRSHRTAFAEHYAFDAADPFYEAAYLAPDRVKTLVSTQLGPSRSWRLQNEFLQIYDLRADADELVNLADDSAETRSRRAQLLERAASIRALRFEHSNSSHIAPAELERLQALGYF